MKTSGEQTFWLFVYKNIFTLFEKAEEFPLIFHLFFQFFFPLHLFKCTQPYSFSKIYEDEDVGFSIFFFNVYSANVLKGEQK